MELNEQRVDDSLEVDGVWVDIDDETSLLIARYQNPKHKEYLRKRLEPYKRMIRMGKLSNDVAEKIEREAMAKYILLGWRGMKEGGAELLYTSDNALRLLSEPALAWFYDLVRDLADDLSLFREQLLEDGVDNIKKSSSGT